MVIAHQLFLLLALHGLIDYSLQTSWLAEAKNRHRNPDCKLGMPWQLAMLSHCLQHGLGVFIAMNSLPLALLETVVHYAIDCIKCENGIGPWTDQGLHLLCKIIWVLVPLALLRVA